MTSSASLLLLLAAASAPSGNVSAQEKDAERVAFTAYDTVKVADGIHAFLPKRTGSAVVSGNSVAVIGDEGVLVVDSGHFPSATRFREQFAHGDEQTGRAFDGFFLGPGFPRAYREATEGPLHDET